MKVLLAYDGSDCANEAINDLPRAGLDPRTQVMVLSVADVWPHLSQENGEQDPEALGQLPASARHAYEVAREACKAADKLAHEGGKRVEAAMPDAKVTTKALADSPAWGIVKVAEETKPDLVILGSHGRSAVGRLLMGSISTRVMQNAECSVRISRDHKQESGPMKLVLAYDASPNAKLALKAIQARTWPEETEITVLTVADVAMMTLVPTWEPAGAMMVPPPQGEDRHWFEHEAELAAETLRKAGLRATHAIRDGDPKYVIIYEAQQLNAEAIYVGAKGHGRIERMVMGSVSMSVAQRASCSVEIVR